MFVNLKIYCYCKFEFIGCKVDEVLGFCKCFEKTFKRLMESCGLGLDKLPVYRVLDDKAL